jgi:hypothetical protein
MARKGFEKVLNREQELQRGGLSGYMEKADYTVSEYTTPTSNYIWAALVVNAISVLDMWHRFYVIDWFSNVRVPSQTHSLFDPQTHTSSNASPLLWNVRCKAHYYRVAYLGILQLWCWPLQTTWPLSVFSVIGHLHVICCYFSLPRSMHCLGPE